MFIMPNQARPVRLSAQKEAYERELDPERSLPMPDEHLLQE